MSHISGNNSEYMELCKNIVIDEKNVSAKSLFIFYNFIAINKEE